MSLSTLHSGPPYWTQDPSFVDAVESNSNEFKKNLRKRRGGDITAAVQKTFNGNRVDFNTLCTSLNELTDSEGSTDPISEHPSDSEDWIKKIEDLMLDFLDDIMKDKPPKLSSRELKWDNCFYDESADSSQMIMTSFGLKGSRKKFCVIIHLLSTIHRMLITGSTCTKRELYYQNVTWIKSQVQINGAIEDICRHLDAPPWELGVLSTAKGLIAGSLIITAGDGRKIDCMVGGGVLIPQDVVGIKRIQSNAKFILVIEKDTVFQKLLDENALVKLSPVILITGKGYPDINTRLMLKMLVDVLEIPSYALVDADPHGIEIMCIYRFGSLSLSHMSEQLAVPTLRWIGVYPSEIVGYALANMQLTKRDVSKSNDLLKRPYCIGNSDLRKEITVLLEDGHKSEIEAMGSISEGYLTDNYIQYKLRERIFI